MAADDNVAGEPDDERKRTEALAQLRKLRRLLPPDFHFDREEANSPSGDSEKA